MTTTERAEKIADLAEHILFSDIPDDSFTSQGVEGRRLLRQTIAAQIDEAVKEALRARCYQCAMQVERVGNFEGHICEHMKSAFSEGYAAAREQAAGIVEKAISGEEMPAEGVAERIRAMTPGGK